MLVERLLQLIPYETKSIVDDAIKKYGPTVRELVRSETRLSFQWGSKEEENHLQCQCPVSVDEIGYPEYVAFIEIPDKYSLAAKLAIWKPALHRLHSSSSDISHLISTLGVELEDVIDVIQADEALMISNQVASQLLAIASLDEFDLVRFIHEINEDILGAYQYDASETSSSFKRLYRARISIYWGVIGLFARSMGASIEGLTVNVLAHELSHAYTHLGFDRNGKRWTGKEFGETEHRLKEGLAQYYAARVLQRLQLKVPAALKAYKALLPLLPDDYRSHLPWLETATPEAIGAALAVVRHQGPAGYEIFDHEVSGANRRLSRNRDRF